MLSDACTKLAASASQANTVNTQASHIRYTNEMCSKEQLGDIPPNARPHTTRTSCHGPRRSLPQIAAVKWTKTGRLHSERYQLRTGNVCIISLKMKAFSFHPFPKISIIIFSASFCNYTNKLYFSFIMPYLNTPAGFSGYRRELCVEQ